MLTMTERATIFFSHYNEGKKPEDVGLKEALPFSYDTLGNKVKGVVFAPSKEIANAFVTNQKTLWSLLKATLIGGLMACAYLFISIWLNVAYGISTMNTLVPMLAVLFVILMVLPFIFKKLKKNQKMIDGKIFVYTE